MKKFLNILSKVLVSLALLMLFYGTSKAQDGEPALSSMGFDVSPIKVNETTTLRIGFLNNGFSGDVTASHIRLQISLPTNKVYSPQGESTAAISGTAAALFDWVYNAETNLLTGTPNQSIGPGQGGEISVTVVGRQETTNATIATTNIVFLSQAGIQDDPENNSLSAMLGVTGVMPVTLVNFNVVRENTQVVLSWSTTSEVNSDYFEVQHSLDARSWSVLGKVKSQGESTSLRRYSFSHSLGSPGINYYRLRMVDKDLTFDYSPIKSLEWDIQNGIAVYPNPVSDRIFLKELGGKAISKIAIVSSSGKVVYTAKEYRPAGIPVANLSSGLYVIEVTEENGTIHRLKAVLQK